MRHQQTHQLVHFKSEPFPLVYGFLEWYICLPATPSCVHLRFQVSRLPVDTCYTINYQETTVMCIPCSFFLTPFIYIVMYSDHCLSGLPQPQMLLPAPPLAAILNIDTHVTLLSVSPHPFSFYCLACLALSLLSPAEIEMDLGYIAGGKQQFGDTDGPGGWWSFKLQFTALILRLA